MWLEKEKRKQNSDYDDTHVWQEEYERKDMKKYVHLKYEEIWGVSGEEERWKITQHCYSAELEPTHTRAQTTCKIIRLRTRFEA